ncbi:MAG: hypothetical protein AAF928_17785 [Myxococcota bacterium]
MFDDDGPPPEVAPCPSRQWPSKRWRRGARILALLFATLLGAGTGGCSEFDAPPQVILIGLEDGLLPDPLAPLQLAFDEPVAFDTMRLKVVRFITDAEGNLLSDDALRAEDAILYEFDGESFFEDGGRLADLGGADDPDRLFDILLFNTLPVGPQLALVVEAGLTDADGKHTWEVAQILRFGFEFSCRGDDATPVPVDAPEQTIYFLLADVELPIQTQLQLLVDIRTDPATGDWVGQFTNADRDPSIDCAALGLNCTAEEVCRTLPAPACVNPSERAATAVEYPDFIPNELPPIGYSFGGVGCAGGGRDTALTLANAPADVEVTSPSITVKGIAFNLQVTIDPETGLFAGGGTFTGQEVFLGTVLSGAGSGTATMVEVPVDRRPAGIPPPPVGPGEPFPQ